MSKVRVLTIEQALHPLFTKEEIRLLTTNRALYNRNQNIVNIIDALINYVVNKKTPHRYTLPEFYMLMKINNKDFLCKRQKSIIKSHYNNFEHYKEVRNRKDKEESLVPATEFIPTDTFVNPIRKPDEIDLECILLKRLQLYRSAVKRKIDFNLSDEDVRELLERKTCYYTGARFTESPHYKRTVDRIDSNLGYVNGNVVACTHGVNQMKNYMLEDTRDDKFVITVQQLKKMVAKL